MKNAIRCCISCILPCGALDVIRIVHANGRVEEISGSIKASDIMKAHPKYVLKKPSSSSSSSSSSSEDQGCCPKIVVVPPDAELQRGKIYFLMPVPPSSAPDQKNRKSPRSRSSSSASASTRRKKREAAEQNNNLNSNNNSNNMSIRNLLISDRYLSEILSEKISTQRDRRRGRAGIWRPHLESICETPSEA